MLLLVVYRPKKKTLCCLVFNDRCTGMQANTQDSMQVPEEHAPSPLDAQESSPEPDEQGRQRAAAAVRTMLPPNFLGRISAPRLMSAEADTGTEAWDSGCCPMYFVYSWALGWSSNL